MALALNNPQTWYAVKQRNQTKIVAYNDCGLLLYHIAKKWNWDHSSIDASLKNYIAQSAGAVKYTDCTSAEG